jgi:hypothetical protein
MKSVLIILIFVSAAMHSCKKAHSCTCAVTQTVVNTTSKNDGSMPVSSTTTFTDNLLNSANHITKRDAEMTFNCNTRIETYSTTNTTYSGTLTTVLTSDHTDEYDCKLK